MGQKWLYPKYEVEVKAGGGQISIEVNKEGAKNITIERPKKGN